MSRRGEFFGELLFDILIDVQAWADKLHGLRRGENGVVSL